MRVKLLDIFTEPARLSFGFDRLPVIAQNFQVKNELERRRLGGHSPLFAFGIFL